MVRGRAKGPCVALLFDNERTLFPRELLVELMRGLGWQVLDLSFFGRTLPQGLVPDGVFTSRNLGERGTPAEGDGVIHFEFTPEQGSPEDAIKKTIPVTDGMDEWSVTLQPIKADGKSYKMKACFTLNGELAHERVATNIVFGDVWYVGAPAALGVPSAKKKGKDAVIEPVTGLPRSFSRRRPV